VEASGKAAVGTTGTTCTNTGKLIK
jgi:hypothetical protein